MDSRACVLLAVVLWCGVSNASSTSDLSWDHMLKYFMYSMSSFCSADQGLSNWTCNWCTFLPVPALYNITIFETPGAGMGKIYGYVGRSNESIIIAFRGSSTTSNWILDFEFTYRDYPPVKHAFVHDGFYRGYLQVAPIINPIVLKLQSQYPNLTVISTGHSLGAALALLNGAGMVQAGIKNVQVWDYGEPRVGNHVFSNYTNSIIPTLWRVVNQEDIVPHVPPRDIGFHHVATEVWFPSNYTTYVVCNDSGEDPKCSDSIPPTKLSINDHLTYLGYGWGGLQPPNAC